MAPYQRVPRWGKSITVLPRDAWLNIEADHLACNAITQVVPGPLVYRISYSLWVCYLDQKWLVKQFKFEIWTYVNSQKLLSIGWKEKRLIWASIMADIDWEAVEQVFKLVSLGWC